MNFKMQGLENVRLRLQKACAQAGRDPDGVRILAVAKKHPPDKIREAFAAGLADIGENLVQEALEKQRQLADLAIRWHFIGTIQSNKTSELAAHFGWVQSVDRLKILKRLSAQRSSEQPPLNICLQVNIDREPQKSGVLPEALTELAAHAAEAPRLVLRGLMAIPQAGQDEAGARDSFRRVRQLYDALRAQGHDLDTLSMGMSADLEAAVAEGSTLVRIGTDLFGPRPDSKESDTA
ncbi:MAG: YggS family pyridoxal phosphate-dependent enzyme [Xanthomonadales bacterium]|nr:YggS family pyridoxal phosphate-dependent enzyme [Xanthomonadales bacterium]